MQDSLFTLFDKIEACLNESGDDEVDAQVSSDHEEQHGAGDVVVDSEDQITKEVKRRLKDLVEIFEGPSHFFNDDSSHDRAARLLKYFHDNVVHLGSDITIGQTYIIDHLYETLPTLIANYKATDKFLTGLAEKAVKK